MVKQVQQGAAEETAPDILHRLSKYERAVDTLVDIDNQIAALTEEIAALKQARIAVEMAAVAGALEFGIESSTVGNRLTFLRREMDVKVLNEKAAVALCERLDIPDAVRYAVSPENAAKVAAIAPELVDKQVNTAALREYVRHAKLPGARERILAPFNGAVEIAEYTFMRTVRRGHE
jgi:hypothetical protein